MTFVASDAAASLTGQVLRVHGGMGMGRLRKASRRRPWQRDLPMREKMAVDCCSRQDAQEGLATVKPVKIRQDPRIGSRSRAATALERTLTDRLRDQQAKDVEP